MTRLFVAELLKLKTLRSTWGFVLVALLFAGLATAGNIGGTQASERRDPEFQFRVVLDAAFPAALLSLLLGIVLVTNEFRHGTIARTLLATPRRSRLLATKLLAGAFTGIVLMLVTFVVTATVAVVWLGSVDVPLELGEASDGAGRAFVGVALAGLFGAAVGGAVHSQVGALVGALIWILVAEPLAWVIVGLLEIDAAAEYFPAAALGSIVDSSGEGLPFAGSIGVTLAWIAFATVLALLRTGHRDIT